MSTSINMEAKNRKNIERLIIEVVNRTYCRLVLGICNKTIVKAVGIVKPIYKTKLTPMFMIAKFGKFSIKTLLASLLDNIILYIRGDKIVLLNLTFNNPADTNENTEIANEDVFCRCLSCISEDACITQRRIPTTAKEVNIALSKFTCLVLMILLCFYFSHSSQISSSITYPF